MAFVNEKLTKEQREEVNSWGIKYPLFYAGKIVKQKQLEDPWYWTADRERDIYLFGVYSDRFYSDEEVFVFVWNQKNYTIQLNKGYEDGNTVVWGEPKNYIIDTVFPYCEEKNFLDDLKEALMVYGSDGDSNIKISVKCSF